MPELALPSNQKLAKLPPLLVGGYALRNALRVIPIWGQKYLSNVEGGVQQRELVRTFRQVLGRFANLRHLDELAENPTNSSESSDLQFFTGATKTLTKIARNQSLTSSTYAVTESISHSIKSVEAAFLAANPVAIDRVDHSDLAALKAKKMRSAVSQAGMASSCALMAAIERKRSDLPIRAALHDYAKLQELREYDSAAANSGFDLSDQGPLGPAWPGRQPEWYVKLLPDWQTVFELSNEIS